MPRCSGVISWIFGILVFWILHIHECFASINYMGLNDSPQMYLKLEEKLGTMGAVLSRKYENNHIQKLHLMRHLVNHTGVIYNSEGIF